jgi:hypothetical protein
MKATLLKNLSYGGKDYVAGDEVDLPEDIYKWLMNSYVKDRQLEREQLAFEQQKALDQAKLDARRGRK